MTDSSTNKTNNTVKAVRATIYLGDIPLEVFQLPSGEYRLSQTGVAVAIGNEETSFRNFLVGKSSEALPYKGFRSAKLKVDGNNVKINAIPVELAVVFWGKETIEGNVLAARLLVACGIEAIERRADTAFNVQRTEEERQAAFSARVKGKIIRRSLTDAIADYMANHPELSPNTVKFMYSNVSDAVNLIVFGRKACKLRADLQVPLEGLLRDFYTSREQQYVQEVEDLAMRIIDQDDIAPLLAVKESGRRLLIPVQPRVAVTA